MNFMIFWYADREYDYDFTYEDVVHAANAINADWDTENGFLISRKTGETIGQTYPCRPLREWLKIHATN